MTNIEFILAIFAIIGGGITIFRAIYKMASLKAELEKTITRKSDDVTQRLSSSTQRIELQLKEFEGEQKQENYRFQVLESKIQELQQHQRDLENFMAQKHGFARKPYSTMENTVGRRVDRPS